MAISYDLWLCHERTTMQFTKGMGLTASKKEEKEIALYIHIVKGLMAGFGG